MNASTSQSCYQNHFVTLSEKSNQDLVSIFNKHVAKSETVISTPAVLGALYDLLYQRLDDISVIDLNEGFSLKRKVKLKGNTLDLL